MEGATRRNRRDEKLYTDSTADAVVVREERVTLTMLSASSRDIQHVLDAKAKPLYSGGSTRGLLVSTVIIYQREKEGEKLE